jgi:hypothetical protein
LKELTFWQAHRRLAVITLMAALLMCGLFALGMAAAYLLTSGHPILTVLLLVGIVAAWLGLEARSLQRWSRW